MPDNAPEPTLIRPYRQRAIAALIPILAIEADEHTAATIAREMLSHYHPATPREVQAAAQIIALGWAALTCLSAAAVSNLAPEERMRLHDDALALEAMSRQADPAKRAGGTNGETSSAGWDDTDFQATMRTALEVLQRARHRMGVPVPARPDQLILSSGMMTRSLLNDRQRRAATPPEAGKPY